MIAALQAIVVNNVARNTTIVVWQAAHGVNKVAHPPEEVEWKEGVISANGGDQNKFFYASCLGCCNQVDGALQ